MSTVADMQEKLVGAFSAALQVGLAPPASRKHKPTDTLALALADVARHYGQAVTPEAIVAGLPLVGGRLPLEHVQAASERAGLAAEFTRGDALMLADWSLPVLVLTGDGGLDVLWAIERDGAGKAVAVEVSEPGQSATRVRLPAAELAMAAAGRMVRLTPTRTSADTLMGLQSHDGHWIRQAFAGSHRIYAEAIAATFAINILALALPLYTMNVYDRVLPNAAADTMWALSIGVILATLLDQLIKSLRSTFVDTASRRADVLMANHIFARLVGGRLALRQQSVGVRANTLRELETLREFLNSATLTTFGDLPFAILFIAIIGVLAGPLVLVAIAVVPLLAGIGWLTQRSMGRLADRNSRQAAVRNSVAVETLAGLETIKAAGAESWAASQWERAVADGIRTGTEMRHLSNTGLYTVYTAQTLAQVAMIIAGFYMVAGGAITSGALIASTMLAGRAVQPLSQLAMLIARLHQTRIAFRQLSEIANTPQERATDARFLTKTHFVGAVSFEQIDFSYDKEARPALREVSFEIAPGERVGILGAIGTGKSTALKLMQALIAPDGGRVLVDGLPAGQIDPALLRRFVRLALQDADLFHGTIRTNITLADPGASDEAVLRAAEAAGALGWIGRLPRGFDTEVRERGAGLSGGQRQSVALARALLGDPAVMLLDEPTSDMDARTERLVVERLKHWLGKRTMVLVTHRPAMLDLVERLIVLDDGRKILDGPKASVLVALAQMEKRSQIAPARSKVSVSDGGAA